LGYLLFDLLSKIKSTKLLSIYCERKRARKQKQMLNGQESAEKIAFVSFSFSPLPYDTIFFPFLWFFFNFPLVCTREGERKRTRERESARAP